MKTIILLVICIFLIEFHVSAQQKEEQLFSLLQQGKYVELVNNVSSLREKEYYKNAFMDYCLAYGYCQLGQSAISGEWFDHILASYNNLSTDKRRELRELKESCTNNQTAALPTDALFGFLRGMTSDGFEGNGAGIESKMGIPSFSDRVEEFDFEHLTFDSQNRKFTLQQKKEAYSYYQKLLKDPSVKFDTTSHFLIFYPSNAVAIKTQIKELEEYYNYYRREFNLQESNRLITVFYCNNRAAFNDVAQNIHNIPVPKSTFGYASSIDLVMLGIANAAWLGAMKHELFHLMIRSFIGDIPAWLDEGTACFFESSSLKKEAVTNNLSWSNYRLRLLNNTNEIKYQIKSNQNEEFIIPSLQQLTNYNWEEFSGRKGDLMIKASYNQSLSFAFVSYLNERKLLDKTMEAFRNRSFIETPSGIETEGLVMLHIRPTDELLMNVTGMNLIEIQTDFDKWCKQKSINIE